MSEPILAPFWGPTWLHFGPQDASKTASLGLQDALSLASYFRCLFGSIFGPSWGPSWPQLGPNLAPQNGPGTPQRAPGRPLGGILDPETAQDPPKLPQDPPQGLILGPPGTLWGPFWNRFGTSWNRFWGCFWYLFGRPLGIFPRLVPPEFLSSSPTQTLPRIQWGLLWPHFPKNFTIDCWNYLCPPQGPQNMARRY